MSADVWTQHNDNFRTGANTDESVLNWSNVDVNSFGKINEFETKGFIWAQPLYARSVRLRDKVRKNLIVVATSENWLYAFDADAPRGSDKAVVWSYNAGKPVPSRSFGNNFGDMYRSTIGILGTPVIQLERRADGSNSGTIFAIAMLFEEERFDDAPDEAYTHMLLAVDLATGLPRSGKAAPVKIEGEVQGGGYSSAGFGGYIEAGYGAHAGSRTTFDTKFAADLGSIGAANRTKDRPWPIADTIRRRGKDFVQFNSAMQLQRPGLLLVTDKGTGTIYSAFGARADQDPYHGWVFAHDADTLERKGVFCTSRDGRRAGVWQAAEGISADKDGDIYVGTGNGDIFPAAGCFGDSLLKLRVGSRGLELQGFSNAFEELENEDEDFGASAPTIVTDRLMVGGGKDGHFYVFDQPSIDPWGSPASVKQLFVASYDATSKRASHHIHGSPVVYDSGRKTYLYVWGENDLLRCFEFDRDTGAFQGQPNKLKRGVYGTPAALGDIFCSADGPPDCMHGGFLAVSACGTDAETGIVWTSFPAFDNGSQSAVTGELRAYQADAFEQIRKVKSADGVDLYQGRLVTLWSSRCNLERDASGNYPKFCVPTVADGRVLLPSFGPTPKLMVYGLLAEKDGGYDIGFGGKTDLVFNGNASICSKNVRLVEKPHRLQAGSVFHKDRRRIANFETAFTISSVAPERDPSDNHQKPEPHGFTFTFQGISAHALGEAGGGFGYGADVSSQLSRGFSIEKSFAVAFGLRSSVVSFYTNGIIPAGGDQSQRPAGTNLNNETDVVIRYKTGIVMVELHDLLTGQYFEHRFAIDLERVVGDSAFIGFTAGTDGRLGGGSIDVTRWSVGGTEIAKADHRLDKVHVAGTVPKSKPQRITRPKQRSTQNDRRVPKKT
jgi:hypothetical protein